MGCDIHLYVEKRENGQWLTADKWGPDKYEPDTMSVEYDDRFYTGRNYNLFAILADVRNGRGFAGVKTGDGFNVIAEPRGLPADVTAVVQTESESWGLDGHSHSFFTVSELLSFDWTQTARCQGWVDAVNAEKWLRRRKWEPQPDETCGSVDGPCVKHVGMNDMEILIGDIRKKYDRPGQYGWHDAFIAELKERHPNTYALAVWEISYAATCKAFWWETVPKLLRVGSPDDVRIVFWFDN